MDPATVKFQQVVPYVLLQVDPALSAIHAARARRSHTGSAPHLDSCARCGTFLFASDSSTRIARFSPSRAAVEKTRTCLQSKCGQCCWVNELPLAPGNASLFPRRNRPSSLTYHERQKNSQTTLNSASLPPKLPHQSVPLTAPALPASSKSKSRPKKKSGLQEMLARNKEKEEQRGNKAANCQSGLAAFLDSL